MATQTQAITVKNWTVQYTYNAVTRTIPEPTTIGGPIGDTRDSVEVTRLDADERQYVGGFKNVEENEFTFNFIAADADQQAFIADAQAGRTVDITITDPNDSTSASATGDLLGYRWNAPAPNEVKTFAVSFRPRGSWTFA